MEAFYAAQGQENSGYVTDGFLRSVSKAAGVDAGKALSAADGEFAMRRLERADSDATRLGVNAAPYFTVAKAGGQPRVIGSGVLSHAKLKAALEIGITAPPARRFTAARPLSVAVALVGLGIASYLTVVHYAGGEPVCAIAHGCATVQMLGLLGPRGGAGGAAGPARLPRHPGLARR